jgi:hypothetical protein
MSVIYVVFDLCFASCIIHNLSTSHHHQASPGNIASFNLGPLSWPYMEMSGEVCSDHVPQACKDVVQLEWALPFHGQHVLHVNMVLDSGS